MRHEYDEFRFRFMNPSQRTPYYRMTVSELLVLKTACGGAYSRHEIAQRLGIAPDTVRTHLSAIYARLGVASFPGMILFALYDDELRGECFPRIREWAADE